MGIYNKGLALRTGLTPMTLSSLSKQQLHVKVRPTSYRARGLYVALLDSNVASDPRVYRKTESGLVRFCFETLN